MQYIFIFFAVVLSGWGFRNPPPCWKPMCGNVIKKVWPLVGTWWCRDRSQSPLCWKRLLLPGKTHIAIHSPRLYGVVSSTANLGSGSNWAGYVFRRGCTEVALYPWICIRKENDRLLSLCCLRCSDLHPGEVKHINDFPNWQKNETAGVIIVYVYYLLFWRNKHITSVSSYIHVQ